MAAGDEGNDRPKHKGEFFALGLPQFQKACELGLNPTVALLVLARGTGRDNSTTTWSANSIENYAGITWRRASEAVDALKAAGIVRLSKAGARPVHTITKPERVDDWIWIPNQLVSGAVGEASPVARLRQARDLDALRLLVELYFYQELLGDGGIPRDVITCVFERKRLFGHGPYEVLGFTRERSRILRREPFLRFWAADSDPWPPVEQLLNMGLLEEIDYLAEGGEPDAELIHALNGDDYANDANSAAFQFIESLPQDFRPQMDRYHYVLPVMPYLSEATIVSVYRLRYRAKTRRTAAWYGRHVESCKEATEFYSRLASGQFNKAGTDLKVVQGTSRVQGASR